MRSAQRVLPPLTFEQRSVCCRDPPKSATRSLLEDFPSVAADLRPRSPSGDAPGQPRWLWRPSGGTLTPVASQGTFHPLSVARQLLAACKALRGVWWPTADAARETWAERGEIVVDADLSVFAEPRNVAPFGVLINLVPFGVLIEPTVAAQSCPLLTPQLGLRAAASGLSAAPDVSLAMAMATGAGRALLGGAPCSEGTWIVGRGGLVRPGVREGGTQSLAEWPWLGSGRWSPWLDMASCDAAFATVWGAGAAGSTHGSSASWRVGSSGRAGVSLRRRAADLLLTLAHLRGWSSSQSRVGTWDRICEGGRRDWMCESGVDGVDVWESAWDAMETHPGVAVECCCGRSVLGIVRQAARDEVCRLLAAITARGGASDATTNRRAPHRQARHQGASSSIEGQDEGRGYHSPEASRVKHSVVITRQRAKQARAAASRRHLKSL